MVEQRPIRRAVHLEFAFDRLLAAKLELAYDILVPDRVRIVGSAKVTGADDEDRGDLRSCIVGLSTGRGISPVLGLQFSPLWRGW
jgi:hypothetical protein